MGRDELAALLDGYVSKLEKLVLHTDDGRTNLSSAPMEDFGSLSGWGDRGENSGDLVGRLAPTMSPWNGQPGLDGLARTSMTDVTTAAVSAAGQSGSHYLDLPGLLAGRGTMADTVPASSGGEVVSSAVSALVDLFRGIKAESAWDGYERQRHTWETPSHIVEGVAGVSSRIEQIDSAFDGSPRTVERGPAGGNRIEVRIEALDARSFLERKEDIAEAVRQAMLTSGVLGTPLNEY